MRTAQTYFGCALLHEIQDQEVVATLQQRLYLHCRLTDTKYAARFVFPGPQPLSIERADFPVLHTKPYVMCEKTDGHRGAMMFDVVHVGGNPLKLCVLFNRSGTVWICPIQKVPSAMWQGSVFDGEVVLHAGGDPCFLIFDAIRISGMWLEQTIFTERLAMAKIALQTYEYTPKHDPLTLKIKAMIHQEDFGEAEGLLSARKMEFNTDGILLIPDVSGFTIGRAKGMFKLKPPGTHTVDFIVEPRGGLSVYKPDKDGQVVVAHLQTPVPPLVEPGMVVECAYTGQGDIWKVVLVRDDKSFSNDYLTFTKTLINQQENLSVADIISTFCSI